MNALGKIIIAVVVLILLIVVVLLAIGFFNDSDKNSYRKYVSGNSPDKLIITNDHSLGQLYSIPLGTGSVPGEKVLFTKMHADESSYPNPTKRVELQGAMVDSDTPVTVNIEAINGIVNANAAIIQPGTIPDYSVTENSTVSGILNGIAYSQTSSSKTVFNSDGSYVTTFSDGSKKSVAADGTVTTTDAPASTSKGSSSGSSGSGSASGSSGSGATSSDTSSGTAAATAAAAATASSGTSSTAGDAEIAEAFSNYDLVHNTQGFNLSSLKKDFDDFRNKQKSGIFKSKPVNYANKNKVEGLDTDDTASTKVVPTDNASVDEVVSSVGVTDEDNPVYIYEIELENVLVNDIFGGDDSNLDTAVGTAEILGIDLNRGGREGLAVYPDKFYVDAAGNRIFRRSRRATINGWLGPYVDVNGNIHYNGTFELIPGARPVSNWCLPPHRRIGLSASTIEMGTWSPHTYKIKEASISRQFDSGFNAATTEVLSDNYIRQDLVGDFNIKPAIVYDTIYNLQGLPM